jgi:hypothetical protein
MLQISVRYKYLVVSLVLPAVMVCVVCWALSPMEWRSYLWNLFGRAFKSLTAYYGTNGPGFLVSVIVSTLLAAILTVFLMGFFKGREDMKRHLTETLLVAVFCVAGELVIVWGPLYLRHLATVAFGDYETLVSANQQLSQSLSPSAAAPKEVVVRVPNEPHWNEPAGPATGPIGPIQAAEMVQEIQKPCTFKITSSEDKINLQSTIRWLIANGSQCEIWNDSTGIPSADTRSEQVIKPTQDRGLVIHWNETNVSGEKVAHFFQSSGYIVRTSHRMPPNSPPDLIWLDFGPGSPFRDDIAGR